MSFYSSRSVFYFKLVEVTVAALRYKTIKYIFENLEMQELNQFEDTFVGFKFEVDIV